MSGSALTRPRGGGIRKQRQKRDRDGDLVMGAAPRVATAARASGSKSRNRDSHTAPFIELKVTGWTDEKEVAKLINFLERHAARRSPKATKGSVPPKMVKRHSAAGTLLKIWVRPEDVPAFGKINGFTFTSTHGTQKLTITGPGIHAKSSNATETSGDKDNGADKQGPDTSDTVELLKGFLSRRYQADEKLLNLAKIADDEEVAKSGMFSDDRTQRKFFPALMVVCDTTLKSAEEKREAIHSVILSGNNLPNLDVVRNLSTTLPHIQNLDLSGNNFANLRVLKHWKNKFRFLEHLIVEVGEPEWEEEIISWFPKLRILNGQQVRPDPAPTPVASAAAPAAPAAAQAPTPAVSAPILVGSVSGLTPEQEQMIVYVMEQTNLKREMALQCLEAGKWDINTTGQLFLATKDTLGPESFNS